MSRIFRLPKEINHNGLFFFGVLFYFVAPVIILQTDMLDGMPGIDGWKENRLDTVHLRLYIALIIWLFITFYLGSYIGARYINIKYTVTRTMGEISSRVVFVLVSAFVGLYIFKLRGSAFQGHGIVNDESDNLVGVLSTANLLLFYIHFVIEMPRQVKRMFGIVLIVSSVFLLGLGGRMYVIIPLVAYFVRAWNKRAATGKSMAPYVLYPVVGAFLASILGALRIGEKLDKIPYFIFAEPIFTSYAAFSYLNENSLPWVSMPNNFFVSFLNIVPSLIWPGKADTLNALNGNWAKYDNPLGALSVFVSIYANFGILLSGAFMIFLGGFFGQMYNAYKAGRINKNVYYCFCSVLPFCFFRDPIALPIKIYILSFSILPFFLQVLTQSLRRRIGQLPEIKS